MKTSKQIKSAPVANFLMKLDMVEMPVAVAAVVDPVTQRRNTLVARLNEQLALLKNPNLTRTIKEGGAEKQSKIRSWVRPSGTGFAFIVKSGLKALELSPGKFAVAIKSTDALPGIIATLISATEAGELDDAMAKAAAASARKPKAAKAS